MTRAATGTEAFRPCWGTARRTCTTGREITFRPRPDCIPHPASVVRSWTRSEVGRFPVPFEAILELWFMFLAQVAFVLSPALRCFFSPIELELFLNALRLHTFVHWGD
jgi:hypothetical protein